MDKWSKIKSKLYNEKLNRVESLFAEVHQNVNSGRVPRNRWTEPLEIWTTDQINEGYLSLQEFAHFKEMVEDLNQHFIWRDNEKNQVIKEFKGEFTHDYFDFLQNKENDLKLEVTAELIEEKQFPLEIFVDFYNATWHLSEDQFNEELGSFWGDVWKHAGQGAGIGAAGGAAAGGIPTGGMGTFAGAGLGGLAGGMLGGLYGGGKNLLQRVWHYRQTRRNFEQTKEKALETLKRLRDISKGFDLNPNFMQSLDSMIDQLGTAKAYRVAGGTSPSDADAVPGKAVDPTKLPPAVQPEKEPPHPGWAELGKHSGSHPVPPSGPSGPAAPPPPSSGPPPSGPAAPPPSSGPPPSGPAAPPKPPVAPKPAASVPLAPKPAAPASTPAAPPVVSSPPPKAPATMPAPKPAPAAPPVSLPPVSAPAEPATPVAASEPVPPPEGEIVPGGRKRGRKPKPTGEEAPPEFKDAGEIIQAFNKGTLVNKYKTGVLFDMFGVTPDDLDNPEFLSKFGQMFHSMEAPAMDNEEMAKKEIDLATDLIKKYEEKRAASPSGTPAKVEMPTVEKPVEKPVKKDKEDAAVVAPDKGVKKSEPKPKSKPKLEPKPAAVTEPEPEEEKEHYTYNELLRMGKTKLQALANKLGIAHIFDRDSGPSDYAAEIDNFYQHPHRYRRMSKESVMVKYGKVLREHKLTTLTGSEKVEYLKSLLKG